MLLSFFDLIYFLLKLFPVKSFSTKQKKTALCEECGFLTFK